MLTFTDDRFARGPSLIGRRDFLRIGSLGGLALPELLTTRSQAAMDRNVFKNKSVVFLFLQGGPPQIVDVEHVALGDGGGPEGAFFKGTVRVHGTSSL